MAHGALILLFALLAWFVPGWSALAENGDSGSGVVAEMGGVTLTTSHFQAILADLDPEARKLVQGNAELLRKLARDEVVKLHLKGQAEKMGIGQRPDVAERMARAANQVLISSFIQEKTLPEKGFPDEKLLREAYDNNKENLRGPTRFHMAQIYLEFPKGASVKAKTEVIKEAHSLFREISTGKKDFEKIAKSRSQHKESASKGGDMGWLEAHRILPDLVPIFSRMMPGELSNPVPTSEGVHIFRLLEVEAGEIQKFEQVREFLAQSLRREASSKKEQQFLSDLLRGTPPVLNEDLLKKSVSP